jgi:hypothetical protein
VHNKPVSGLSVSQMIKHVPAKVLVVEYKPNFSCGFINIVGLIMEALD